MMLSEVLLLIIRVNQELTKSIESSNFIKVSNIRIFYDNLQLKLIMRLQYDESIIVMQYFSTEDQPRHSLLSIHPIVLGR